MAADPSSAIAASAAGWDYPISREALAILDLFDATVAINSDAKKRPKPHSGRPFQVDQSDRKRVGDTGGRTQDEIKAILNAMGHSLS